MFVLHNSRKRASVEGPAAPEGLPQSKKLKKVTTTKTRKTNKKAKTAEVETSKTVTIEADVPTKRVSKKKLIMDL